MASLITCPHCGVRPKEEFTIRGDASPVRPAPEAKFAAWDAYVHLRDNVRGVMAEHWQHSGGCRRRWGRSRGRWQRFRPRSCRPD